MTRLIAGRAGGRRLTVPPAGTRPTSDRAREGLFSTLESLGGMQGLRVADLYAGSGAVGLEALSRGAAEVVLVEADRRAVAVLRRNVAAVALPGATVVADRVARWAAAATGRFDLIFADPPYSLAADELTAVLVALRDRLAPDALIVVERSSHDPTWHWMEGVQPLRDRAYGEAVLWYGRAAPVRTD
jgi:16S rRNA (guanine966-N2)-methyltransferase